MATVGREESFHAVWRPFFGRSKIVQDVCASFPYRIGNFPLRPWPDCGPVSRGIKRGVMFKSKVACYLVAVAVIFVWSITFVCTKVLLRSLSPEEIVFYRYLLAYLALLIAYPKFHRSAGWREELLFLGAGIFGGTLYFITENYALKFSLASNVGLLVATSPMLTAVAARFLTSTARFSRGLIIGFGIAFAGAFLVIFNGHFILKISPLGDSLALMAAASWALYSILVQKIGTRYNGAYITRKVFFYTLLTMIPVLIFGDFRWDATPLFQLPVLLNLLFLGVVASSVCFLLWSQVIWRLGAVTVNNFIYLVPLVTMLAAAVVLDETITPIALLGGLLILAGVYMAVSGRGPGLAGKRGRRAKGGVLPPESAPEHP